MHNNIKIKRDGAQCCTLIIVEINQEKFQKKIIILKRTVIIELDITNHESSISCHQKETNSRSLNCKSISVII